MEGRIVNINSNSGYEIEYETECDWQRKQKSLYQKFSLIDIYSKLNIYEEHDIYVKIMGTREIIYTIEITFSPSRKMIYYSCSCPDFIHRYINCKHLYWFGKIQLNKMSPNTWNINDMAKLRTNLTNYDNFPKGRNDKCLICLEKIHYASENTINCVDQCKNSIHALCWNKYTFESLKYDCVMCRQDLFDILME